MSKIFRDNVIIRESFLRDLLECIQLFSGHRDTVPINWELIIVSSSTSAFKFLQARRQLLRPIRLSLTESIVVSGVFECDVKRNDVFHYCLRLLILVLSV